LHWHCRVPSPGQELVRCIGIVEYQVPVRSWYVCIGIVEYQVPVRCWYVALAYCKVPSPDWDLVCVISLVCSIKSGGSTAVFSSTIPTHVAPRPMYYKGKPGQRLFGSSTVCTFTLRPHRIVSAYTLVRTKSFALRNSSMPSSWPAVND
jgi:hypothetical protein